jgi:hypothetical protein
VPPEIVANFPAAFLQEKEEGEKLGELLFKNAFKKMSPDSPLLRSPVRQT